tara:strand:+ start:2598 stop:3860 length:1263 start_codon:yes stop_codon:yes gene_type:complete
MFFLYQILIIIIIIFSPIIILIRLFKKKEHPIRFKEKFSIQSKKRSKGNLIWFHGASVGEILSIIPLVKKLEKNKEIKTILITSSTISSAIVYKQYKSKKTVHQFFPIDSYLFTNKFLKYWQPSIAIFIDSEIWPNMYLNIKKKNIPLLLLNARITKKSFERWSTFKRFSKSIFNKIDIAYPQNKETLNYLKRLNVSKIRKIGNLKFSENQKNNLIQVDKLLIKKTKNRKVWCASSTHAGEEIICGKIHIHLKKKYPNLLTIIIPRHIRRTNEIKNNLNAVGLNVTLRSLGTKIERDTDIYLVDTYGETKKIYKTCKTVFLGGSLVKHGGQNPIEAARLGSTIIHGPFVNNFKEVYKFLNDNGIAIQANNMKNLTQLISNSIKKININTKYQKINKIGIKILNETTKEINRVLKNDTKKT